MSKTHSDLVVTEVNTSENPLSGNSIKVRYTVKNIGDLSSNYFNNAIYLTSDPSLLKKDGWWSGEVNYNDTIIEPGLSKTFDYDFYILDGVSGDWYIVVKADYSNNVFESDENNNTLSKKINIALADYCDLTSEIISVNDTAYHNDTLNIKWEAANNGNAKARENVYLTNTIYLCDKPDFSEESIVYSTTFSKFIPSWEKGQSISFNDNIDVPNNLNGAIYAFAKVNTTKAYFESNTENNISPGVKILISDKLPDIKIEQITIPDIIYHNQECDLTFDISNVGSISTFKGFKVYAFLSENSSLEPSNDTIIGYVDAKAINQGDVEKYTIRYSPKTGTFGNKYLFISANSYDQLLESDNKNSYMYKQVELSDRLPELAVSDIKVPEAGIVDKTVSIGWTVANTGNYDANKVRWVDDVYISNKHEFAINTSVLIGSEPNDSFLNAGERYNKVSQFRLPKDISGTCYITVVTDRGNVIEEKNEENTAHSVAFTVYNSIPDLVVDSITVPDKAYSEQTIKVEWVVKNDGNLGTDNITWTDAVYLSQSEVFDPDGITVLGAVSNAEYLEEGESYKKEASFKLPKNITGKYYVYVYTDTYNRLFEAKELNNVAMSVAFDVYLTPPSDLVVSEISTNTTAFSGSQIQVNWTVDNTGIGPTDSKSWIDYVYVSSSPDFLTGSKKYVGSLAHSSDKRLEPGESYKASMTVSVPNAIYGQYYVYVLTDASRNVYEHSGDSNNASKGFGLDVKLSPPADLDVDSVVIPKEGIAGELTTISWNQVNNGPGSTFENGWNDGVYFSKSKVFGKDAIFVNSTGVSGNLASGAQRKITNSNIQIPKNFEGDYYVFVHTDLNNSVFEFGEDNNNTAGSVGTINIKQPVVLEKGPCDLKVLKVDVPNEAYSGKMASFSWTVKNDSTNDTNTSSWTELIMLMKGNEEFAELGRIVHSGALKAGDNYTQNCSFKIPNGISGNDFSVKVYTGFYNVVNDKNTINNQNTSTQFKIYLSPWADLTPADFKYSEEVLTGEPVSLSWTVKNKGTVATDKPWYDTVYLSKDMFLDSLDKNIFTKKRESMLGANESYTENAEIVIPVVPVGTYYLIFITDSYSWNEDVTVYEHTDENNNTVIKAVKVSLPPPSDLKVLDIKVPENANPGDIVTIDWKIYNSGIFNAKGQIIDSIYISADPIWDINDIFFGELKYTANIHPDSQGDRTLTGKLPDKNALKELSMSSDLPGIVPGNYYVIIRTDVINQIYESDDSNNTTASANTIKTDIASYKIGDTISATLNQNGWKYYKVTPGKGQDFVLNLDSVSKTSFNELYISHGKVPGRGNFEYVYSNPGMPDQEIVVPNTQDGEYYIAIYCPMNPDNDNNWTLTSKYLDFELRNLNRTEGGQGKVTIRVNGAKFTNKTNVYLEKNGEKTYADYVKFMDSTFVYATFDLGKTELGVYDICITDKGRTSKLADGFKVAPKKDIGITYDIKTPGAIRAWAVGTMYVEYSNDGNVDTDAVTLSITSNEAYQKLSTSDEEMKLDPMYAEVASRDFEDFLQPGTRGTITVYFRKRGGTVEFKVDRIYDTSKWYMGD